jgi:serine/threonine protein kinase
MPQKAQARSPGGDDDRGGAHGAQGGDPQEPTSRISSAGEGSLAGSAQPSAVPETLQNLGRYRVLNRLGHGGMGSVWLAEDMQLQRRVALKIPQIPDDDSGDWLARFYREARAAAGIHHSHLCPVYDVGEIDGVHFLTMAYVEGEPLSARIAQRREPWPVSEAATLVHKLALAIDVAHQQGIVHRDLKPANIMINRQGEPVIVDFGLARRADAEDATLTRLGELLGTPAYMSPEQVDGEVENIGPQSDLYNLGVILFELLTGRRPYQGSAAAVLGQILRDPPPPPSNFRAGLDARMEAICCRLLARRPADRYESGRALGEALERYLRSLQYEEVLPVPLREHARPIAPPAGDTEGYGLSAAPTAAFTESRTATTESSADLGERIGAFLAAGQFTEALLACQSAGETFARSAPGGNLIRQAFANAINRKLQARELKQAVRTASTLHSSALPVESADLLAKTLSAVGRTIWNDSDPGPALQLWQKQIEKFPRSRLLAEKAAIFAYNRGLALEKVGKFGTAVALYKVALNYDAGNELVQKRLATACYHAATAEAREGRLDPARRICDETLRALPGNQAISQLREQLKQRMLQEP